jgi:hypothetical protein
MEFGPSTVRSFIATNSVVRDGVKIREKTHRAKRNGRR